MIKRITITGDEILRRTGHRYQVCFDVDGDNVIVPLDWSSFRLLTILGMAYKQNHRQGWVHRKDLLPCPYYVSRYLHRLKKQIHETLPIDWNVYLNDRQKHYRLAYHGPLEISETVYEFGDYNINRLKRLEDYETKPLSCGITITN